MISQLLDFTSLSLDAEKSAFPHHVKHHFNYSWLPRGNADLRSAGARDLASCLNDDSLR